MNNDNVSIAKCIGQVVSMYKENAAQINTYENMNRNWESVKALGYTEADIDWFDELECTIIMTNDSMYQL